MDEPPRPRPNWLVEALEQLREECRLYLATVAAISLRPRRFILAWKRGEARAMNPLVFLAATFAVVGFSDSFLAFFDTQASDGPSPGLILSVLSWAAPFAYYLFLGILAHLVLRLFGSAATLLDSCAVALYAGGGPATVAGLVWKTATKVYCMATHQAHFEFSSWVLGLGITLPFFFYCFALGAGLRAAGERVRRWHVALAVSLAVITSGFAFGVFDPPGEYGMHPVFTLTPDPDGRHTLKFSVMS